MSITQASRVTLRHPQRVDPLLKNTGRVVVLASRRSQSHAPSPWVSMNLILETYWKSKGRHTVANETTSGLDQECLQLGHCFNQASVLLKRTKL